MRSRQCGWWLVAVAAVVASASGASAAPANGVDTVDLSSLDGVPPTAEASLFDDLPVQEVASWDAGDTRRLYVTGYLGSSFATLNDRLAEDALGTAIDGSILTAGGAVGVAYTRGNGLLRVEFEGMGRDDLTRTLSNEGAGGTGSVTWGARDGWSTLFNVWRDVYLTDRLGVYVGGGIGAGGYRYGFGGTVIDSTDEDVLVYSGGSNVATFAWQAGGGVAYNITDRIVFDVGYRFYAMEQADTTLRVAVNGVPESTFLDAHRFTASELLFGLRIYEPFRNWR